MINKLLLCTALFILTPVHLLIRKVQGTKQTDGYIPCNDGWLFFGGNCYKMFGTTDRKLNRYDASNSCKIRGGHLATVESKEVQEFLLANHLLEEYVRAWIGLNDIENETHYKWDDGTEYNYTNWNTGEPTGFTDGDIDEDCVEMLFRVSTGKLGEWRDSVCTVKLPYICQVESKKGIMSRDPTSCSSEMGRGWKFGSSCYNIVEERMTWEDAEKYCQEKFNGHLVTIMNFMVDYILQYIMSSFSSDIWIGIKMKNQPLQQFSSGWYAGYTKWFENPNSVVDGTCVLRTMDEVWDIVPCNEKYPFICEVSTDMPEVVKKPPEGSKCPDMPNNWMDLGGEFCYFIGTNSFNWYRANFECNRRGGSLASFHSRAELRALTPIMKNTMDPYRNSNFFTGRVRRQANGDSLATSNSEGRPHTKIVKLEYAQLRYPSLSIGLYRRRDDENVFAWADGSPLDFTNWDGDAPNNKDNKCGVMPIGTTKWNAINCDNVTDGYICSVRKISPNVTETEVNEEDDCISGITFRAFIGTAVFLLLMVFLLSVVIYYLRPCTLERRRKSSETDIPIQSLVPPNTQLMTITRCYDCRRRSVQHDSDEGYELMD